MSTHDASPDAWASTIRAAGWSQKSHDSRCASDSPRRTRSASQRRSELHTEDHDHDG